MEHAPEKRIEFLNIRPQDINTAVWIDYANKLEAQNSALLEALKDLTEITKGELSELDNLKGKAWRRAEQVIKDNS